MSTSADRLVDDYLDRLEGELVDFPSSRRRELVQEISEHIAEARAQLDPETEAGVRNVLERMGDPADIAAEARGPREEPTVVTAPVTVAAPAPAAVQRRAGGVEIGALILLLFGGLILPVVGWFVGVVPLWVSSAWTVPQKLLGMLVVPGGLALPIGLSLIATSVQTCVQFPVAGSYSSALVNWLGFSPPATSTLPEGNSVAVCESRAVPMSPVGVQLPVAGS